jgi:phosphatidylserine decarboxylase
MNEQEHMLAQKRRILIPKMVFWNNWFILFQYVVPQRLLTWVFGKLANCQIPYMKNYLIRTFLRRYDVSMEDAVEKNPYRYANFQTFFIRTLQAAKRPIAQESGLVSPVDGTISQMGCIQQGMLIQAKGFEFDLLSLLGNQADMAADFENGEFMTLYLAPKDYHRVHFPSDAKLISMTYIPGRLFSVNQQTSESVPRLFARNERVICYCETKSGPMAVILVGAMIVGSIHTAWAGEVNSKSRQVQTWSYVARPLFFKKGEELGYFKVGSTVILLHGTQAIKWRADLGAQKRVQMGELLSSVE